MATDVEICSTALVMIGASPIASLSGISAEIQACQNLYERTVRNELSLHRWRFAVGQEQISRLATAPLGKWDAAYQIPPEMLTVNTVRSSSSFPIPFDRFEDNIYCNASEAEVGIAEGVYRIDEQFWPPYFQSYIEIKLASLLASALAERGDLAQGLDQRAMRQAAQARNVDSQGRTAVKLRTSRMISRRFRNGSQGYGADYE